MWSSKSTCDFITCETHVPRSCVSHVKFHMWFSTCVSHVKFHVCFTCEISHGIFYMWNLTWEILYVKITCDTSHVKRLIWFLCTMWFISRENWRVKFHKWIFTSGIFHGGRSHMWNLLLFDFSNLKYPMWFSSWDFPHVKFHMWFFFCAVLHWCYPLIH